MHKWDKEKKSFKRGEYIQAYRFKLSYLYPRFWGWWLGFMVIWSVSKLPLSWNRGIARRVGKLVYTFAKSRNAIARKNILLCFPEWTQEKREALLRENCYYLTVSLFDTGIAWFASKRRIKCLAKVDGIDNIKQTLASGTGVLLCGCHKLPIEMALRIMSEVLTFSALYRVHDNEVYEYVSGICRRRYAQASNFIPRKKVRDLLYFLKDGKIGIVLADHDLGKSGVFVPFLGEQAATVTSVSDFAKLGKAKVITLDHYIEGDYYRVNFSEVLDNFPSGDKVEDTKKINQLYEQNIRAHPEQYLWQHRRFKTRPEGSEPVYERN